MKELKKIMQSARLQGWEIGKTKKGHWKFTPPNPNCDLVFASGTPSDRRSIQNLLAELKRQEFRGPEGRK